ncbi:potassium channel family protein [Aquibacillus kalidii]|uniref:potassium channel family protein n=1 Tax=Aquibacillus kalidii TaxID=2762597 RepID=UPI001645E175|nr:potassium channel family protein [Aquibacillus kalidii]
MYLHRFLQVYFRMPILFRLISTVFLIMILFGVMIHFVEPTHFPSIFDGVWWAFITGSTVGYGDYVPLTITGKMIAILLILTGGGLITFYMATISAGTIKREHDLSEGKVGYRGKNHIILVGWNERTKQLIDMILKHDKEEQIVLIDRTLSNLSYRQSHIHFIRGSAAEDDVLSKANVKEARYAIITSDPSKQEQEADQSSILSTVAMRGNNPNLFIITEILIKEQISNAKRAGADTVIRSNDFMSTLFFREIYRETPVKPFELLLDVLANQQFTQDVLPDHLHGKTFHVCLTDQLTRQKLLIGMKREGEYWLNPPPECKLKTGDVLIFLKSLH